jgi:adenylylsulfate kinase-like enzyme
LLEIESEEKADMQAFTADAATNRVLKEEQAREIASAEARSAEVIGATLRAVHSKSQLEIGRGEDPKGLYYKVNIGNIKKL